MASQSISRPMIGLLTKKKPEQHMAERLYEYACGHLYPKTGAGGSDAAPQPVTVVCLSDTHNTCPSAVPPGEILLHAGDFSQYGTYSEIAAQLAWLRELPHAHKIVIAGNHDLLLDKAFVAAHPDRELDYHRGQKRADLDWGDIVYLEHSTVDVVVHGRSIRIFGSPWTPRFGSWAFQYDKDEKWEGMVLDGTDVVVSYGPPAGHLDDGSKGCEKLLQELWRSRPALVVCGHIHIGRGMDWLTYDSVQYYYEKAILINRERWRRWISLGFLAISIMWLEVQRVILRRPAYQRGRTGTTRLVNAAVVSARGNKDHHAPVVITI